MKNKFIYICVIASLLACKPNQEEVKYNLDDLIGYWAETAEDDVSFSFNKEGDIKYFDYNDGYDYKYTIKDNILIIKEEEHIIAKYGIVKMTSDSLGLKTETGNTINLYKRKIVNLLD
jgi:hypothetical protein